MYTSSTTSWPRHHNSTRCSYNYKHTSMAIHFPHIPFFRIFYSTTYTLLFFLVILLLAITPAAISYTAIEASAWQYVFMVNGVYFVVAVFTIIIYSSRLYTNRTILAAVGKPYIPVEEGEVRKKVRAMFVTGWERSAIVAWESRPRDSLAEVVEAETSGVLPSSAVGHEDEYTLGRIISVDPANPPWGRVQHPGWSSSKKEQLHFAPVIAELPHLIEARAASLAPDPLIVQREETMGMREHLLLLSSLRMIQPPALAQSFLKLYETARYSGRPVPEEAFTTLMTAFAELLAGMIEVDPAIIDDLGLDDDGEAASPAPSQQGSAIIHPEARIASSSLGSSHFDSPVTAREQPSPYLSRTGEGKMSVETFGSVVRRSPEGLARPREAMGSEDADEVNSLRSFETEVGSVIRHGEG